MAQVDSANNPNDPNNPNNLPGNQAAPQGANQPTTTGGGGPVTATGAANVTGQVVGTATPSQPFQNISSYLAANAPQSADLANKVASSVTEPINKAQGDITNASQTFSNSVNAGFTPENNDLISRVTASPTEVAANPDDVAAFQKQLNDTYTGPTDITTTPNYSNIESEIANAQSLGQNALTPTGIQTLLRGVEGPTTAGVNNLDTLLLAQNPDNFQTVKNAGLAANTTNNNLQNFLDTATKQSNTDAQTAAANARAASGAAGSALSGQEESLASALAKELADAQGKYTTQNNLTGGIQTAIDTGNPLSSPEASLLGIDPAAYSALLGIIGNYEKNYSTSPVGSLGQYLKTGTLPTAPPTNATVASADEYALSSALSALAGPGRYAANPLANPNPSSAGTWNAGSTPPSFDLSGARKDVSNKFSNADLNYILNTNSGPIDPLRNLAALSQASQSSLSYGQNVQQAAQKMLGYINQFGPGHYPGVNQRWIDAVTRMANNAY